MRGGGGAWHRFRPKWKLLPLISEGYTQVASSLEPGPIDDVARPPHASRVANDSVFPFLQAHAASSRHTRGPSTGCGGRERHSGTRRRRERRSPQPRPVISLNPSSPPRFLCTHTHTHTVTRTHTHTVTHTHTHTLTHTHKHARKHARTHAQTHTYTHTHTHTHTRAHTRTRTHARKHARTHAQTQTHTCTQ